MFYKRGVAYLLGKVRVVHRRVRMIDLGMKMVMIGAKTRWGVVAAVGWVGERYYWMVQPDGSISMMPADMVEGF